MKQIKCVKRSYLKDTKDTIKLLNGFVWDDKGLLVTADVASLYTCISNCLGVKAVHYYLSKEIDIPHIPQKIIMDLLTFATTNDGLE